MTLARTCVIGLAAVLSLADLAVSQEQPIYRDIQYVEGGHEQNRLDLYLPKPAEAPLPVVVWIHGGGWQGGSKEDCPALQLLAKGYAVASINYRLSQHAVFPSQIEDCKAAIRWLRANAAKYRIDPNRIGVWGGSAGGHLVALLGTTGDVRALDGDCGNLDQSSRVQCVVDWYGPTDFVSWDPNFNKTVYAMITQMLGSDPQKDEEKARKASPVTYVNKSAAPFLIIHGNRDDLVPLSQSETLADALKNSGVDVTLKIVKDAGHGGPGFTSPDDLALIENFFAKHLVNRKQ